MKEKNDIAIVGAGASGLIASIFASEKNSRITLFEKQKKIGRKINASGNGRCNISNMNSSYEAYHGKNPKFVRNILSRFSVEDTIDFFREIGIPVTEELNGKLFPSSLQSSVVAKALLYQLNKKNVKLKLQSKIENIEKKEDKFILTTSKSEKLFFDSVILAMGSSVASQLGASGDVYKLAKNLGHSILEPFPSIIPININDNFIYELKGIKWDSTVSVLYDNKIISESTGELLFTAYGISGPAALNISRAVNENVILNKKVIVKIDFFPQYSESDLLNLFNDLWRDGEKKISFSLLGIIKEKIPEIVLNYCKIDPERRVSSLSAKEKEKITSAFKNLILHPGVPRDLKEAVVAAGGVTTDEIDHKNMESRIVKNLFITGELLDIDGDSGGYNLQFAWSTGAIAGKYLSK